MININSGKFPSYAQNLGVDLLAYILNEDSEFIQSLLSEGGSLNTDKYAVLLQVDNFMKENKRDCVNDKVLTFSDRVSLSRARCQDGTLALNQYRILSGGDFEKTQSDDLVKKVLERMCVDWFPFTLLPTSNDTQITGLEFPSFYGTSVEKDFIHAVEADSVIMKLFPDYSGNIMEPSCQYYTSIGQGGGIHITTLHSQLLGAAHALMDVKGAISLGDFQRCAGSMVDCLRAALSGEQCGIPLIHVFDLVGLPNDFSGDTAIGIVRCLPKSFEKHIPKGARPARGIQYASILERKADYSISLAPKDDDKNLGSVYETCAFRYVLF